MTAIRTLLSGYFPELTEDQLQKYEHMRELYGEWKFHLVDSIGKKIHVVEEIARELHLQNVTAAQVRAEQVREKFDFVVSRAVTRLAKFYPWVANSFKKSKLPTKGIYYLKGGDLTEEIAESGLIAQVYELKDYFSEEFFETKKVVYVPMKLSRMSRPRSSC